MEKVDRMGKHSCAIGSMILQNDEYKLSGSPKITTCATFQPKCGYKTKKVETYKDGKIASNHIVINYGCFSASELEGMDYEFDPNIKSVSFENLGKLTTFITRQHPNFFDSFRDVALENATSPREDMWVESPPEFLFDRKNESRKESGFVHKFFGEGNLTPIMLIYILFICVSVIFKLLWLISVAWKSMKQGYQPVKMEVKKVNIEGTVEELD
ncbi:hypothetical protein L3Y34_014576 [Caenorhabditis briggsae]|nr:hypothetical protein L3Y34_014576 [Caenorhabditis briggsae]